MSALASKAYLASKPRVRRAATNSSMGGSLWKAMRSQHCARVQATNARPSLLTQDEDRDPAKETTQPSRAVIP